MWLQSEHTTWKADLLAGCHFQLARRRNLDQGLHCGAHQCILGDVLVSKTRSPPIPVPKWSRQGWPETPSCQERWGLTRQHGNFVPESLGSCLPPQTISDWIHLNPYEFQHIQHNSACWRYWNITRFPSIFSIFHFFSKRYQHYPRSLKIEHIITSTIINSHHHASSHNQGTKGCGRTGFIKSTLGITDSATPNILYAQALDIIGQHWTWHDVAMVQACPSRLSIFPYFPIFPKQVPANSSNSQTCPNKSKHSNQNCAVNCAEGYGKTWKDMERR